jgi:hypothetical protein
MERKDEHTYRGRWICTECANLTKTDYRYCRVDTFIVPHDCIHKTGVRSRWNPIECPMVELLQWIEENKQKIKVINRGTSIVNGH